MITLSNTFFHCPILVRAFFLTLGSLIYLKHPPTHTYTLPTGWDCTSYYFTILSLALSAAHLDNTVSYSVWQTAACIELFSVLYAKVGPRESPEVQTNQQTTPLSKHLMENQERTKEMWSCQGSKSAFNKSSGLKSTSCMSQLFLTLQYSSWETAHNTIPSKEQSITVSHLETHTVTIQKW